MADLSELRIATSAQDNASGAVRAPATVAQPLGADMRASGPTFDSAAGGRRARRARRGRRSARSPR